MITPLSHSIHSGASLHELLVHHGLEISNDAQIRWATHNPDHPRNWPTWRKALDIGLIMFLDFYANTISTSGTPVAEVARSDFNIDRTVAIFAFTSMYLFGQAVGGLVLPPFSESFGRKQLYVWSSLLYAICCALIGLVHSLAAVFIFRFITGFLSAIPTMVVAGSIEDIFDEERRTWIVYLWATVSNVGLVVGSVMATYISYSIGWRWVFYVSAIVLGSTFGLLLCIRESRPSQLLEKRVKAIRKAINDPALKSQNPDHAPDWHVYLRVCLFRPVRLLVTEPIVIFVSLMKSIAFALIYLFTEAVVVVYSKYYGFTPQEASLALIPMAIGLIFGVFIRVYDSRLLARRWKAGLPVTPESKLFGLTIAAPTLALGLWWFAWTIPPLVSAPWIVSILSLTLLGFATNEFDSALTIYISDSYTLFASSAFAGSSLLRSAASATFPLFGVQMYQNLGGNVATSILAATATVFCTFPFVFQKYGERIREASTFAKYSTKVNEENRIDGRLADAVLATSTA